MQYIPNVKKRKAHIIGTIILKEPAPLSTKYFITNSTCMVSSNFSLQFIRYQSNQKKKLSTFKAISEIIDK